jgi:hypothetical protein
MITPKFSATINERKLKINDQEMFLTYLSQFKEGDKLTVSIAKRQKIRSDQANRYLWGVVYKIASMETGHTSDEIHEVYKRKFLPAKFVEFNGMTFKMPGSTAGLNTVDFWEFTNRVIVDLSQMGMFIPSPDSVELT